LHTDTDIEGDDSGFSGGDGSDSEEDDDSSSGPGGPVDGLLPNDTPEDAMKRSTQVHLRDIINELMEGAGDTDVYTLYFMDNFTEIVDFYTLFTKYGPFEVLDRPSEKKRVVLEVACAYMMMNQNRVRFTLLAKVTGYSEPNLVSAAIGFLETYKGEEYRKGAYLLDIYVPALNIQANFLKPMKLMWNVLKHPKGNIRSKVVAFIGAYVEVAQGNITVAQLERATGISRGTLTGKMKAYIILINEALKT
jgi:hypothetical protein